MLDHDESAVVRESRNEIRVHDFSLGDGAHFIEWFAAGIAIKRADIDAFVKTFVDSSDWRFDGIAHKAILSALPRR